MQRIHGGATELDTRVMLVGIKVGSTTPSTFLGVSSTQLVVAVQGTRAGIDASSTSQGGQACKAGQNY